jgi:hypothetical protein
MANDPVSKETVPLRSAPEIAGIGVAELLRMVRDNRLRVARVDGEVHLYVAELHAVRAA